MVARLLIYDIARALLCFGGLFCIAAWFSDVLGDLKGCWGVLGGC